VAPTAGSAITPPKRRGFTEALTVFEPARMAVNSWRLLGNRPVTPRTVLVLPGFGAGDASTAPLRAYLRSLGHHVTGWGLSTNSGQVLESVHALMERVERRAERAGVPVALVGWSLGGVISREIARQRPDLVDRVITLGSPVVGGPKYTIVAKRFREMGVDLDAIEHEVAKRAAMPPDVAVTALYSRYDGVVAWQACIDPVNAHVEHIEVQTTHLGLGINHTVWRIVAERLALPPRRPAPTAATPARGTSPR
jgi:pimeloyl-ACP methyl ester carboxylesterase